MLKNKINLRRAPLAVVLLLTSTFSACTGVQTDKGIDSLNQVVRSQGGEPLVWDQTNKDQHEIDKTVKQLISAPVSLESAVKIALLNNPGLRAELQRIGIAQADVASASSVGNPLFSVSQLKSSETTQLSLSLEFNFLNLIMLPQRKKIAEHEFEQTRLAVGHKIIVLSHDVKLAWYEAVAQAQQEELMQTVMQSTEAASRLAYKQVMAGTGTKREQAKKQVFFNQAKQKWIVAKAENYAAKEKLNRLMGFSSDLSTWSLNGRLPELPAQRPEIKNLDKIALANRLDIAAAAENVSMLKKQLSITTESVLLNNASVGAAMEKNTGEANKVGPSLSVGLPLNDIGNADKYRGRALLRQSEFELAALSAQAASEVRAAHVLLQARYDVAQRQQQVVLPLRNTILSESQLLYNGMLGSVYALLEDRKDEVESASDYIAMLRDYWFADADLNYSLGGASNVDVQ